MPKRSIAGRWTQDLASITGPLAPAGQAWLDQMIARSPVGIAVIDIDGQFQAVNPAYCEMHGHTADALLAGDFLMMFFAEQRAQMLALHRRFLTEGGELKGEWSVRRADGQALAVLAESVRVPGADGQTHRLVYVVDISERKRMEVALLEAHHFLQSVIDGLAAHVCVLDQAGTIVAVNRAWADFAAANGGLPASTGVGASYLRAAAGGAAQGVPPLDFLPRLQAVLAGHSAGFEAEYDCHANGRQRWFVARVSSIAGSTPPHFVIAHDEVTALKQAQASVRQREALMRDLVAHLPAVLYRLEVAPGGQSHFSYVSPAIEQLTGLTPAQVMADRRAMLARIEPDDLPAHRASIRAATLAMRTWSNEYRVRALDGSVRWVQSIATPVAGALGWVAWSGMLTDVSDRKQAEARLMASEETHRTLFETVPQGVVYQDTAGRITSANAAAQRILGLTLAQLQGRQSIDPAWRAVREDGSNFPGDQHPAMQALASGQPVKDVVMGIHAPDRGLVWIRVAATPLFKNGLVDAVYASFEDITRQVDLSQDLLRQASTDDLTGVANRRSFMARLGIEFQRVQRHPEVCCSLVALDIDWFKRVNDTWGHAAGDAVLRHFSRLMGQATRQGDVVGRTGGEEFMLLLPDTGPDDAVALAQRLGEQVAAAPLPWADGQIAFTVSAGVSALAAADASVDEVLARADVALYAAKDSGRNTVRTWNGVLASGSVGSPGQSV